MDNCKFRKIEIVDGIKHEICTNEDLRDLNKANGKNIPCMKKCGKLEEKNRK